MKDINFHYSIKPNNKNFLKWDILLFGPNETIFEGGIFKCQITFTIEYPNKHQNLNLLIIYYILIFIKMVKYVCQYSMKGKIYMVTNIYPNDGTHHIALIQY